MVCGSNRYAVVAEVNCEEKIKHVVARTPAEARKKFRAQYGVDAQITSVKEMKSK